MFTVEIGSIITTLLWIKTLFIPGSESPLFIGSISLWLWFTVIFANFSEALAEGRGKARGEAMRRLRTQTIAKRLKKDFQQGSGNRPFTSEYDVISSSDLKLNDRILCGIWRCDSD